MHPILRNRNNILIYSLAWIFAMTVQAGVLVFYFALDTGPSLTDSVIFNTIFFAVGLILWYPVRSISLSTRRKLFVYLNLTVLGMLVLAFWISVGYLAMSHLFRNNEIVIRSVSISLPYRVISGTLLYVMILLVYYLIVYSRNLRDKAQNEAKLETMVKEVQLDMLRSQMNPHFLFNSLNSASALTISDPAASREMIVKLSEYLRYSLKMAEREVNPLADEMENINRYLEIEKVRFGNKMRYSIETGAGCESRTLPQLILQPLFENALKHGVYESTGIVTIRMKCWIEGDLLVIRILNNFDTDSPGRGGAGIGLKNVRERLRLVYGRDDLLHLRRENGQFIVNLFIPGYENKGIDS